MYEYVLNSDFVKSIRRYYPVLLTGIFLCGFTLYWFNLCGTKSFLVFGLIATLIGSIFVYLYCAGIFSNKAMRERLVAAVFCFFAVVYTFAFPPLTVPDEAYHFYSSYWLADVLTGQIDEQGFIVRTSDWELFSNMPTADVNAEAYRNVLDNFELFQSNQSTVSVNHFQFNINSENPPAKIATVVAIIIGKLLNLGTYPLFYLGRLINAVSFAICMIACYRIIPFGKTAVAVLGLLPMMLHLSSSYSYDVGIIALGMLSSSLILKAIVEKGPLGNKLAVSILVTIALLAPCKLIYSTIALLTLLIPNDRFKSNRNALIFKGFALVLPFLMILSFRMAAIGNLSTVPKEQPGSVLPLDTRGTETGHFYDISFIIKHPAATISLFFQTILSQGDFYWSTMLGRSLGWFQPNISVPYFYCIPMLFAIAYAAQRDNEDDYMPPTTMRLAFLIIVATSFAGSMLSMMLMHTFDTETFIHGVQGRYVLPVALLLFLALRAKSIRLECPSLPRVVLTMSIINIVILIQVVGSALD